MSPVMPYYFDPGAAAEYMLPDFIMKTDEIIANKYALDRFVRAFVGEARADGSLIAVVLEFRLCAGSAVRTSNLLHATNL